MNKRQRKKNKKKVDERLKFFFGDKFILIGRQCGKTRLTKDMFDVSMDTSYRRFKVLKKYMERWRKFYEL